MLSVMVKTKNVKECSISDALFFLFTLIGLNAQCQKIVISGDILDVKNHQPIPFASIKLENEPIGTISNSQGYFALELDSFHVSNRLVVSSVGYRADTIEIRKESFKILLEEKVEVLDEVVVSQKKLRKKKYRIGTPNIRKGVYSHIAYGAHYQNGILIIPELENGSDYFVEFVKIKLDWGLGSGKTKDPFRLRIYKNNNGYPGDDLLNKPKIYTPTNKNFLMEIDEAIKVPREGLFIVIEWIPSTQFHSFGNKKTKKTYYGQAIKLHVVSQENFDLNSKVNWWQFNPQTQQWISNPNRYKRGKDFSSKKIIPCITVFVSQI